MTPFPHPAHRIVCSGWALLRGSLSAHPGGANEPTPRQKRAACVSKRPKSREETPKEGSGNARRYRTAINTRQRTNDKGRQRAGRPNLGQFVFRHAFKMGLEGTLASKVQQHLAFDESRRVRIRSGCTGSSKSAATLKRNGRLIAGRDPYKQPSRPTCLCPVNYFLDQANSNALLTHRAIHKYGDYDFSLASVDP
jgi:hypothetical protein